MARLFIDAQHGLCNRLRAMASAASIAHATGRDLVVIWVPDAHCMARLSDLIDCPGPVLDTDRAADLVRAAVPLQWNYMEVEDGADFQAPILVDDPGGDVLIRSAYTLTSPHRDWRAEQRFLRTLVPAAPVIDLLDGVRLPNDLAVHIRMATGPDYDHIAHEAPENWPAHRHTELVAARRASHAARFIDRIDALIAARTVDTLFLAADLPETYAMFRDRYGDRVSAIERDVYDRSVRQLQYGLADLIGLSAAGRYLASAVSSFSDMAQRLAPADRPMERAGEDF